jgi:hypothetical protein
LRTTTEEAAAIEGLASAGDERQLRDVRREEGFFMVPLIVTVPTELVARYVSIIALTAQTLK